MTAPLLLALLATPASAESEILFRTTRPVTILVDGRQAPITGDLRMRASELEAGAHEVEVRGVFGKTLYVGEIELEDWTVAHAEWVGGDLAVYRTEPLKRPRREARRSPWADEEEEAVDAPVRRVDAPEATAEEVSEPEPEGIETDATEEVAEPSAEALPLALPALEPAEAGIEETELPMQPIGEAAVRIQAMEGVRLELVGEGQVLVVTLRDGTFVVEVPAP